MFEPNAVFNNGDVDVNVVFAHCDSADSAKEIANRYNRLLLHPSTREIFLLDCHGVASPITSEAIICKVCAKELGKPIDCTTEEGKRKAIDTIVSMNPAYSVSEDDMIQTPLDKMWDLVSPRANNLGFVAFDSIAYGVIERL